MRIKKHDELRPKQLSTVFFHIITPLFYYTWKQPKNKSWRRCRLYFRGIECSVGGFLILKQIIVSFDLPF
jgi:hypothetical protein